MAWTQEIAFFSPRGVTNNRVHAIQDIVIRYYVPYCWAVQTIRQIRASTAVLCVIARQTQ